MSRKDDFVIDFWIGTTLAMMLVLVLLLVLPAGICTAVLNASKERNSASAGIKTTSFIDNIEKGRPKFLPLTVVEIQRVKDREIEKANNAINEAKRIHKKKYGTPDCKVCCSDHMKCKYCDVRVALTKRQHEELMRRESRARHGRGYRGRRR